jgi:hypothetical protein
MSLSTVPAPIFRAGRLAVGVRRPELLGLPAFRRANHAERAADAVPGRPVVLVELDYRRVRKIAPKAAHDAHIRAAPPVDALVVVADHAQVVVLPAERLHGAVLHLVHAPELVDEHVPEAAADVLPGEALRVLRDAQHRELRRRGPG